MSVYVGIGTSAGGVEALQTFFANVPTDLDTTFFVVQHLLPDAETMMDKILQKATNLPVQLAADGIVPEKRHIYLNVPGKIMRLDDGYLRLEESTSENDKYTPINQFLQSLANDDSAVIGAVILTGSGSDGVIGAAAIKKAGGFVIVQEPSEALYPSMPQQIITAELADVQLPLAQIGKAIANYINNPSQFYLKNEETLFALLQTEDFRKIVSELSEYSNIDFWSYKAHTVVRRIEQRVALNHLANIHEYAELFSKNSEEKKALYKSLLVGVTSFFRDTEAFEHLRQSVLLPMLQARLETINGQLRIWDVACSTGEEVYSIAIVVLECLEQLHAGRLALTVKIFATDIDGESIAFAQKGVYSTHSLKNMPKPLIEKYFTPIEDGYIVTERVRRMVVFARHNILKDPPFSNLDLIVCRNMLIYVRQEKQYAVFASFQQMLNLGGYLFLGNSESLGIMEQSFDIIDRKWKIFRKKTAPGAQKFKDWVTQPVAPGLLHDSKVIHAISASTNQVPQTVSDEIVPKLFAALAGPCIIVNSANVVVQIIEGGGKYIRMQDGLFNDSLEKFFPKDLVRFIQFFIAELTREGTSVYEQKLSGLAEYPDETLVLRIRRLSVDSQDFFMIHIDGADPETNDAQKNAEEEALCLETFRDRHVKALEDELHRVQCQLKQVLMESDRKNEELQSTNEELLASNEELQSTNEEMGSVNEELYTVNAEYQNKISELTTANADFDNLLNNAEIGALYIDENMDIRKITPIMLKKSNLLITDIGRPINQINFLYSYPSFINDIEKVFSDGSVIEKCITDADGWIWLIRIRRYFWADNRVNGILVTLFDVTKQLHAAQLQLDTIVDSVPGGVLHLTFDSRPVIDYANKGFYALCGYTEEEIKTQFQNHFDKLIDPQDRSRFSNEIISARQDKPVVGFECRIMCKNKNVIWISIQAIVMQEDGKISLYCTVLDISAIKDSEERIVREKDYYAALYENIVCGIVQYEKSDNTLRCYHANEEAIRMLGFNSFQEFRDQNKQTLGAVSTGTEIEQVIQQMLSLKKVGDGTAFEHQVMRTDGTTGWVRGYAKVVETAEGKQLIQSTFVDVTKEKESLLYIDQERQKYQTLYNVLYNTAVCGIMQVDIYQHKIVSINREALTLLKASKDAIEDAIFAPRREGGQQSLCEFGDFINSITEVSGAKKTEITVTLHDNSVIVLSCSVDEINLDNGGKTILLSFTDITGERQLKETEMRLQVAEKTSETKTLFLSKMSHEIRTPMNAIVGMIEILRLNIDNKERVIECLEKMSRSMRHLKLLVNDVLDMSKIESGKMSLEYIIADLHQLLTDIIDEFSFEANAKKIQLKLTESITHATVQIDLVRLREILGNLLSNAIKFTDDDGVIELAVSETVKNDLYSEYTFRVKDSGCGIKPENINIIFEAFEQGHDIKNYGKAGTGLGLSICKSLVELMKGKLEVKSVVGEGSEFFFSIPICYTEENDETLDKKRMLPDRFSGFKVLLAEDNELNHEIEQTLLETYGFIVDGVWNGKELIEHYELKPDNYFDFILLDIQMPLMNGLEATRRIRQSDKPDAKTVPIIAMSANAFEEDIQESHDAGVTAHIAKPMDISFLLQTLTNLLKDKKKTLAEDSVEEHAALPSA